MGPLFVPGDDFSTIPPTEQRTHAMALAIFDLDNTLLRGDSDHAWGEFLVERGLVDGESYRRENERYYAAYQAGTLDIFEFLAFALKPLAAHPPSALDAWHHEFMHEKILPMITPMARALVERHRARGDTLLIITATNRFVTAPIAHEFGIEHLIATEPEMVGGRYTGRVAGIPSYREGKVERLRDWLQAHGASLADSHFYSDSHNDLPLLRLVAHPVAVNPDTQLRDEARARGWTILQLA
jgi:HAD superfamily hydrolase (TIGR01490 family)